MMKKFMIIMLALLMFIAPAQAQAAAKINLAIDGLVVPSERVEGNNTSFHLEARPQMRSNSVFVPVRVVSEILGADVSWENPNINIKYEDMTINLTVGSRTAYKGEQKITLPAAPYVRSGYTYVPIRFVAEAFDCDVEWQSKKNIWPGRCIKKFWHYAARRWRRRRIMVQRSINMLRERKPLIFITKAMFIIF